MGVGGPLPVLGAASGPCVWPGLGLAPAAAAEPRGGPETPAAGAWGHPPHTWRSGGLRVHAGLCAQNASRQTLTLEARLQQTPHPLPVFFSGGGEGKPRRMHTDSFCLWGGGGGRPLGRVTPGRHEAGPRPQHSPDCPSPGPLPSSPTARAGPSAPDPMPALPSPSCPSPEEAMTWPPAPAWGPRIPPAGAPSSTPRPGCGARGLVPWSAGCFQDVTRAPKVTVAGEPKLRRLSVATDAVPF